MIFAAGTEINHTPVLQLYVWGIAYTVLSATVVLSTVGRSLQTRLQFVYDAMLLLDSGNWSLETMHAYQQTLQPPLGYSLLSSIQYTLCRMEVNLISIL